MILERNMLAWVVFIQLSILSICCKGYKCDPTDSSSICSCDLETRGLRVFCPSRIEPKITLHLPYGIGPFFPEIYCGINSTEEEVVTHLNNIDLGQSFSRLKLVDCPLPEQGLRTLISAVGGVLSSVRVLKISGLRLKKSQSVLSSSFNGLQSLKYLEVKMAGIKTLGKDLFINLPNLLYLDVGGNSIDFIHPQVFSNVPKLKQLHMVGCGVSFLPNGVFQNLTNLEKLQLNNNRIKEIPEGLFGYLEKVIRINLSFNKLRSLPQNVFQAMNNLEDVTLNCNHLETLPENLLAGKRKLRTFIYRNTGLCKHVSSKLQLPLNMFSNSTIEIVQFSNILVTSMEPSTFEGCRNLKKLYIINTRLVNIPDGLLKDSKNIEELKLVNNRIKVLPQNMFTGLTKLSILDMSGNLLSQVESHQFDGASNLQKLSLSRNQVRVVNSDAFGSLAKLTKLDLSHNNLTSQTVNFSGLFCKSLKSLLIKNNSLSTLQTLRDFVNLETLDLSENNFSGTFHTQDLLFLSQNVTISLDRNFIQRVIINSSRTTGTTRLSLSQNPILCDCFASGLKEKLERKSTESSGSSSSKNLQIIIEGFTCSNKSYKELNCPLPYEHLYTERCPLNCSCKYNRFFEKITVNCSDQNMTVLPKDIPLIQNQTKSIDLIMKKNKIENMSHFTKGINADVWNIISRLDVSENLITDVHYSSLPPGLVDLAINKNLLKELSPETINYLQHTGMKSIRLGENPYKCGCESEKLFHFIKSKYLLILDKDEVSFDCKDQPISIKSVITSEAFCDPPKELLLPSMIFFVVFVVVFSLVQLHLRRLEFQLWLYSKSWAHLLFSEETVDMNKEYDAFISYSHHQAEFVEKELWRELETPSLSEFSTYRCCVHTRDFIPGEMIPDQIVASVSKSRRTIIVLSQDYCQGLWTKLEFQAAHQQTLKDKTKRLILLIHGDLPPLDQLDPDLRRHLKLNTAIRTHDKDFWRKLRFALPHKKIGNRTPIKTLSGSVEVKENKESLTTVKGDSEILNEKDKNKLKEITFNKSTNLDPEYYCVERNNNT